MKPTRSISPPGTYFVTSTTWQRRSLFVAEPMARLFLQTLYSYRRQGIVHLHEFVLMPEHFHILFTPSGISLERAVQFVKGGYSHSVKQQLGNSVEIWERGFTDHRIRDLEDYAHHRLYIHQNPVTRGLVKNAAEYRYSSAYPGYKLDPWPVVVNRQALVAG